MRTYSSWWTCLYYQLHDWQPNCDYHSFPPDEPDLLKWFLPMTSDYNFVSNMMVLPTKGNWIYMILMNWTWWTNQLDWNESKHNTNVSAQPMPEYIVLYFGPKHSTPYWPASTTTKPPVNLTINIPSLKLLQFLTVFCEIFRRVDYIAYEHQWLFWNVLKTLLWVNLC